MVGGGAFIECFSERHRGGCNFTSSLRFSTPFVGHAALRWAKSRDPNRESLAI